MQGARLKRDRARKQKELSASRDVQDADPGQSSSNQAGPSVTSVAKYKDQQRGSTTTNRTSDSSSVLSSVKSGDDFETVLDKHGQFMDYGQKHQDKLMAAAASGKLKGVIREGYRSQEKRQGTPGQTKH